MDGIFDTFFNLHRKKRTQVIDRGNGEIIVQNPINFIQASKGDTIAVVPGKWLIITNLPYDTINNVFKSLNNVGVRDVTISLRFRVIRENEERKYALVRLIDGVVVGEFSRTVDKGTVVEEHGEYEIEGLFLKPVKAKKKMFRESGYAIVRVTPWRTETREVIKNSEFVEETVDDRIDWKITDENKILGKYMKSLVKDYEDGHRFWVKYAFYYDYENGICLYLRIDSDSEGIIMDGEICRVEPISEEELREISKYYSIKIPVLQAEGFITVIEVFYRGSKRKIVDVKWMPKFEVRRNRYTISEYMKRKLPRGFVKGYWKYKEFVEFIKDVREKTKALRPVKKFETDKLEQFMEQYYLSTPRKKMEIIRQWIRVFEKVKDLAPKATLYVIFYGRKRDRPKYVGFRVDKDGRMSVLTQRIVPVSGIVFKGGEFEKEYREAYNIERLIKYQAMSKKQKLEVIMNDVEEVRKELRDMGVEPSTSSYKDVVEKLKELALSKEYPDNVVWVFLQYVFSKEEEIRELVRTGYGKRTEEAKKLVIGLIKTGRREDFERLSEKIIPAIRSAIKYTVKCRGYSQKKGVMFLGNPEDVKKKIYEALMRIRGRALALYEELEEGAEERVKVSTEMSRRIDAILSEIS